MSLQHLSRIVLNQYYQCIRTFFSAKPELALVLLIPLHLPCGARRNHAKEPDAFPPHRALATD
jgi:hypothetical protein